MHTDNSDPTAELSSRLRETLETLESIVEDRALLAVLPRDEQTRLIQAAGFVFCPDSVARRRLTKALVRQRNGERAAKEEERLGATGIRALRRKPTFTTPNVFPPRDFEPGDVEPRDVEPQDVEPRDVEPQDVEPQDVDREEEGTVAGPHRRQTGRGKRRFCYTCKANYSEIHHFYDQLCPPCAELNYRKRTELADLSGRVALLTGGRVKIGYQAGIKLLRAGARLLVTTRFPRDAASRYAQEPDFPAWSDRLQIFGLDMRHTPSVEAFCHVLSETQDRLDFIVNNACQTVRRPPAFYEHMIERETTHHGHLPADARQLVRAHEEWRGGASLLGDGSSRAGRDEGESLSHAPLAAGLTHAPELSQVPLLLGEHERQDELFPMGRYDQDQQQVDLRTMNSWRMLMAEVPSVELLEVHLVNAIAPFIINARLKPLMLGTPERDKHIVNVSAVEGQFYRTFKTTRHPHTNMAKAALNMMTRTAGTDYHNDGIHMNSVDTGWVTDEDPVELAEQKRREHRFHPPLDIVDGAARIVDPIMDGFNTHEHIWGQFLKDYRPIPW